MGVANEVKPVTIDPALPRAREAVVLPLGDKSAQRVAPNGAPYDHRFIASTERLATDGGVIMADGWKTDAYLKRGGPFIENHDLYAHNGLARTMLGSTVSAGVENGLDPSVVGQSGRALMAYVRFAKTPYAQEVKSLYDDGHLRCVSVRWDPRTEQARAPLDGEIQQHGQGLKWVATRADLLELSGVIIGADPGAIDDTPRSLQISDVFLEAFERARSTGLKLPEIEKRIREIEYTRRIMVVIARSHDAGASKAETAQAIIDVLPDQPGRVKAENDKTSAVGAQEQVYGCTQGEEDDEPGSQKDDVAGAGNENTAPAAPDADLVGAGGEGTTVQVVTNDQIPADVDANQDSGTEGMLNDADEEKAGKFKSADAAAQNIVVSVNVDMTPRGDGGAVDFTNLDTLRALIADGKAQLIAVRLLDQTATQDAMAQMDQGFDALDAILAAIGPVRQQLDDAKTLVKNLIATSLETSPDVQNALMGGKTPSGDGKPDANQPKDQQQNSNDQQQNSGGGNAPNAPMNNGGSKGSGGTSSTPGDKTAPADSKNPPADGTADNSTAPDAKQKQKKGGFQPFAKIGSSTQMKSDDVSDEQREWTPDDREKYATHPDGKGGGGGSLSGVSDAHMNIVKKAAPGAAQETLGLLKDTTKAGSMNAQAASNLFHGTFGGQLGVNLHEHDAALVHAGSLDQYHAFKKHVTYGGGNAGVSNAMLGAVKDHPEVKKMHDAFVKYASGGKHDNGAAGVAPIRIPIAVIEKPKPAPVIRFSKDLLAGLK